jgi:hypothetical protein
MSRLRKYFTEEERKEAQKERNRKSRERLSLDPERLARVKAVKKQYQKAYQEKLDEATKIQRREAAKITRRERLLTDPSYAEKERIRWARARERSRARRDEKLVKELKKTFEKNDKVTREQIKEALRKYK